MRSRDNPSHEHGRRGPAYRGMQSQNIDRKWKQKGDAKREWKLVIPFFPPAVFLFSNE